MAFQQNASDDTSQWCDADKFSKINEKCEFSLEFLDKGDMISLSENTKSALYY